MQTCGLAFCASVGALIIVNSCTAGESKGPSSEEKSNTGVAAALTGSHKSDVKAKPVAETCQDPKAAKGCTVDLQTIDWWVQQAKLQSWSVLAVEVTKVSEKSRTLDLQAGYVYQLIDQMVEFKVNDTLYGIGAPVTYAFTFIKQGCYQPVFDASFSGDKSTVINMCSNVLQGNTPSAGTGFVLFGPGPNVDPARVFVLSGNKISKAQANTSADVSVPELKTKFQQ